MTKKPNFLTFITDLQHMQTRAHALGLHITAKTLNDATNTAGWEQANKDAEALAKKKGKG